MEDRELLQLAAKAAGGEFSPGTTKTRTGPTWDTWEWSGPMGIVLDKTVRYPLTNYGDAFELAVRLDLSIFRPGSRPAALAKFSDQEIFLNDCCVRRAIVLAAAEIGKSLA